MKFVEEYKKQWVFIKENILKSAIICLIVFVALSIVMHFIIAAFIKANPGIVQQMVEMIQDYARGIDLAEGAGVTSVKLFFANARATLIMICLGVVPFIFLPAVLLGFNSIVIGMITGFSQALGTMSVGTMLLALLPHGIIEIPALALSAALGLYLCKETTRLILRKSDKPFGRDAITVLKSYVLVVLPMLIIAAAIEGTITPMLVGLV